MFAMLSLLIRIIVTLLFLVVGLLLLAIAVTPQVVAHWFGDLLLSVTIEQVSIDHLVIAVVCVVVDVIGFTILRHQWTRGRRNSVPIQGGGSTELATESVVERLKQDVMTISQVVRVLPTIHVRGQVVDVALEVRTDAGVDVPTKASEVDTVVSDSINRLGLKLGRVKTKIVVARGVAGPASPAAS